MSNYYIVAKIGMNLTWSCCCVCAETLPLSVYDLANAKSSQERASGWKLFHFNSQLEEVVRLEEI